MSRFAASKLKHQLAGMKSCCTPNRFEEWDCGCSFGCETCYVVARCKRCGKALGRAGLEALKRAYQV